MKAIVGYTGFVGSNICESIPFDGTYNTQNIQDSFGTRPELLVYAGLRAEKFLANSNPEKDNELILEAEENIQKIAPKKLVLISTVDVFKSTLGMDEDSTIDTDGLHAYGLNRFKLEQWARSHFPDALIIRLPALFGNNIKKNFIFDFLHYIPSMLKDVKMEELCLKNPLFKNFYTLQANGFYKVNSLDETERSALKQMFKDSGFSALNFTDSRNTYQFYPLKRLGEDIQKALSSGLTLWHPATEPVSAGELYRFLTGSDFTNELNGPTVHYDYRSKFANLFGGRDGYIMDKAQVMASIRDFIDNYKC